MKKIQLSIACASVFFIVACNNNKNLEKVEIPTENPTEEITTTIGNPADVQVDEGGSLKMLGLPYAYNALEPHIDAKTMEIHYSKHHLAYANNLNKAIAGTALEKLSIEEILAQLNPEDKAVRNNAGGYYNHNLFWETIGANKGGTPSGVLAEAINRDFGSFENFKTQFTDAAMKQFGSGWAWLSVDNGKLSVVSTANQDNPLMAKLGATKTPILGIDVWEHAYYLNYQNKRKDYVDAFFNIINWEKVSEKFENAIK